MKGKKINIAVLAVMVFIGAIAAYKFIEWLFDSFFNGLLADWIWDLCVYEQTVDIKGEPTVIQGPYWPGIKNVIAGAVLWGFLFTAAAACIVAYFYAKHNSKVQIERISKNIKVYMDNDVKAADIFPVQEALLEAQLVQIKSDIKHREQLMKDEAGRKNDLITYLAHDLKTPLTSVIGYLNLLDEIRDMPAAQREKYTHIALEKAERLEKLINEFFEITRYNLTQIVLEKETIDLYYMLIQLTDEFYPVLKAHGNTISLHADEGLMIYGDAEKLARVFNNILKNAVAYSYRDTQINVSAKQDGGFIRIQFENKGPTIPAQKLSSIFDKFYRVDDARTTDSGGTGLGLAIAKEIVRLHDGQISAESKNEMTVFTIMLPGRK